MQRKLNIGMIGMGNMGQHYLELLAKMPGCQVVSIWSQTNEKVRKLSSKYQVQGFTDLSAMLDAGNLDAVIVATPHYQHTHMSIEALQRKLHVLVEKPVAAHLKDACRMVKAHEQQKQVQPDLVFAAFYQQRTTKHWIKMKEFISSGRLGKLMRFSWINTSWFRPQAYYDIGNWRGTWKGEGGGVLLNQCAHNIDLLWWLFGMPAAITATASFGKYHHIEVEDEVHSILEYPSGLMGSFIASTSECPGTDRLEIVGEYGKLVCENKKISLYLNSSSALDYIQTSQEAFGIVQHALTEIDLDRDEDTGHEIILSDFLQCITERKAPLIPAAEGLHSLMIINGMVLSALEGCKQYLPINADKYELKLNQLIQNSTYSKPEIDTSAINVDIKASFH
ncbi:Gfo/Idh/MocA family protein [Paenibacillus cremeus]|uniref:Gfo/Idh/MocA family oxidoreductase n=1 Tax=Paenibacillus cremeus TaxID=2163881 RepID=A0A559JVQ9_9BACL|nr:Gfo/Idh/MocA family oxidoreductase [Paenibacillus cremeus]TVY03966.1 Gfo/Idh/MocA family oxidoreductase [Paenibacillus cremeus]